MQRIRKLLTAEGDILTLGGGRYVFVREAYGRFTINALASDRSKQYSVPYACSGMRIGPDAFHMVEIIAENGPAYVDVIVSNNPVENFGEDVSETFAWFDTVTAAASNYARGQLWNPADSGVLVILKELTHIYNGHTFGESEFEATEAAAWTSIADQAANIASCFNGELSSAVSIYTGHHTSRFVGEQFGSRVSPSATEYSLLRAPCALFPGNGFGFGAVAINVPAAFNIVWREIPLT